VIKNASIALFGEVRKSLLRSWTYRANELVSMLTVGFVFVGIGLMVGQGKLDPDQMAHMFVGYLAWFYALSAIGDLAWGLRGEINAGTLEQMSMSPAPLGLTLMGRALSNVMINTAKLAIQGVAFRLLFGLSVPVSWQGVIVLALTVLGILGFGFIIAGATLVFKQFESFANLVQNALLFLNGTILPVETMPPWLSGAAKVLPSTQGIIVLRRVVLDGQSLAAAWQDGSLIWLTVHSVIFFALGWTAFAYCERVAKRQGSLGQY
jgi:ABC-2 type transport system permease protein